MAKKHDLPYMPFYVGDWLKAPEVQCLPYELQGLWFAILCYMWESVERGYLVDASGTPYSLPELSMLLRLPEQVLEQKLEQLSAKRVFSVRERDQAIFSRRMVRDEEIREKRQIAGSKGGKKTFAKAFGRANTQAKSTANVDNENDNDIDNETNNSEQEEILPNPTLEEVVDFFTAQGRPELWAKKFFYYYEAQEWMTAGQNSQPIRSWKAKANEWLLSPSKFEKLNEAGNGTNRNVSPKSGRGIVTEQEYRDGLSSLYQK